MQIPPESVHKYNQRTSKQLSHKTTGIETVILYNLKSLTNVFFLNVKLNCHRAHFKKQWVNSTYLRKFFPLLIFISAIGTLDFNHTSSTYWAVHFPTNTGSKEWMIVAYKWQVVITHSVQIKKFKDPCPQQKHPLYSISCGTVHTCIHTFSRRKYCVFDWVLYHRKLWLNFLVEFLLFVYICYQTWRSQYTRSRCFPVVIAGLPTGWVVEVRHRWRIYFYKRSQ